MLAEKHHPRWFISQATMCRLPKVITPASILNNPLSNISSTDAQDLEEWLSLVLLQSPRVQVNDKPNPFLCRYIVPSSGESFHDQGLAQNTVRVFRWQGLLPASFILQVMGIARKASAGKHWWALRSKGVNTTDTASTYLKLPHHGSDRPNFYCWHRPA